MRNQYVRKLEFFLQLTEQFQYLRLRKHVDGGCRLIQHHQLGVRCKRAGDCDALPLSAGKFMRIFVCIIPAEAYHLQQLHNARKTLLSMQLLICIQRFGNDFLYEPTRIQGPVRILEHYLHILFECVSVFALIRKHVLAVKVHLSVRRIV